ncbi:GNAT family N-acetyltransferase [Roseomonas sp. OT10]|uniref:GNAT family N-acetyltransferase n=1 Tax=Roseomonas cutis TaxID=2897332 RepID=UPI001E35AC48|nr:GNAT family N-acetyltransferase [Roseomonas sp. OT10]UFN47663.1 GNAT family N-acetyltransferase [Roseomonas sp. OT10]
MPITLRRAGPRDLPALFAIRTAVRENAMDRAALAAAGVTPAAVAAALRGPCAAWLALRGRRPLGFAMARAREGDVFALFVRPGAEGRGLGSRLLAEAESWLAARGVGEGWLLTGNEPGLRARGFYRARGWVERGREEDGQILLTRDLRRRGPGRRGRARLARPG